MWQALTQRYYVITLDMLGFGFSKPKDALLDNGASGYFDIICMTQYHGLSHMTPTMAIQ